MEKQVKIKNISTGEESFVPLSLWKEKQTDRLWRTTFQRVHVPAVKEPPEVAALKAKKGSKQKPKSLPEPEPVADPPADQDPVEIQGE